MPPFFIPFIVFISWAAALFSFLPVLKLGFQLTDQIIAPIFFISYLMLVFSWALSGPVGASALSLLCAFTSLYLSLSIKEPALFLQLIFYGALFLITASCLHRIQNKANDKKILIEKVMEDIHLAREDVRKKDLLKEALGQKIHRLMDLQKFSEDLKLSGTLEEAAQRIVGEIRRVLNRADECALYLVDEARQGLSLVAGVSSAGEAVKEKQGSIFDQWAMKRSQAIMVEDSENDFRFPRETIADSKYLRSVCVSPLITENKVLGIVRASSATPHVFDTDDLRLLDIFSSLGAVTIRNILLYDKMEELSIRDSLTGLYLNRYFAERLVEEIRRAELNKVVFSVILLDIDHFKRYNDEYGHASGDLVLKSIASILSGCLEPADLAARYGGEEFVVMLPNKTNKQALRTAEKIRSEIEKNKFFVRRTERRVTASLGVVTFPKAGRTREELLWTVDKNLYEAKALGRNRVCGRI